MTPDQILSLPAPDTYWIDHGRRNHRLVRHGDEVIAQHRDGRSYRLPWPPGERVPDRETFAARIFNIASNTRAERSATPDPR